MLQVKCYELLLITYAWMCPHAKFRVKKYIRYTYICVYIYLAVGAHVERDKVKYPTFTRTLPPMRRPILLALKGFIILTRACKYRTLAKRQVSGLPLLHGRYVCSHGAN